MSTHIDVAMLSLRNTTALRNHEIDRIVGRMDKLPSGEELDFYALNQAADAMADIVETTCCAVENGVTTWAELMCTDKLATGDGQYIDSPVIYPFDSPLD